MSDRKKAAVRWVRGLVGGSSTEPAVYPMDDQPPSLLSGLGAVLEFESQLESAVLCAVDGVDRRAFTRSRTWMPEPGAAVAAAYGSALAGQRATAVVQADEVGPIVDRLRRAVDRHVPFTLYVIVRDLAVVESLAGTGSPVAVARDPQHVVDLGLVARYVAEHALLPVTVVLEQDEVANAIRQVHLPVSGLIDEYLGAADDRIAAPTPAQLTLFGERRRRVPAWFDPGRPTAHGQRQGPTEDAAASVGRQLFFLSSLPQILAEAIDGLRRLAGRDAGIVSRDGANDPDQLLVLRGAAHAPALAAVDQARSSGRGRVGVLGVNWFVRSTDRKIVNAAAAVSVLTVVERNAAADSGWAREVSAICRRDGLRIVTAGYRRLTASGLLAACRNADAGAEARAHLELAIRPPSLRTEFPRRQAMLDRLRRDYPGLEEMSIAQPEDVTPRAADRVTVACFVESPGRPESDVSPLAATLATDGQPHVCGSLRLVERGLWELRLTFSSQRVVGPGADLPVDLLLLGHLDQAIAENPLRSMAEDGSVVIASALGPAALAAALPDTWRVAIRARGLKLFRIPPADAGAQALAALLAAAAPLLSAEPGSAEPVPVEPCDDLSARKSVPLPFAVRRFGEAGETYDNVARFWSELIEPRLHEPQTAAVPDPYLAAGAVPACSSSLGDASQGRETVPSIDPERCTGCGRCWESCPDSAIGAVALASRTLLDALADQLTVREDEGQIAGKLKRAHRQLAARLDAGLAGSGAGRVTDEMWSQAFGWLFDKMALAGSERIGAERVRDRLLNGLEAMPLSVCDAFFAAPRGAGSDGELLFLAINPRTCQGCGICESVCPEGAVEPRCQTPEITTRMDRSWRSWEALPDTAGATIARLSSSEAISPLAAVLLSRHCALAVTGSGSEPGSGERLAARQVAAVVEFQLQRSVLRYSRDLEELERRLRAAIRETLGQAIDTDDLTQLSRVLDTTSTDRATGLGILAHLEQARADHGVDERRLRSLVELCRAIGDATRGLTEGEHGLGRARYGIVLHGDVAREWAGTFPLNPFSVPVAVDLARDGADLALGLVAGVLDRTVREARLVRRAELWLEPPTDLPQRERQLETLDHRSLTSAERAPIPPIVLFADAAEMARGGGERLLDLLGSGLPVKIVLFDECDLSTGRRELSLVGLARRDAFVLSTSIAHPRHLFHGVSAALDHPGPALIQIHAPSPRRHGFPTSATIDRARTAVGARVHPLLRYDPQGAGVFGTRIDLDGNPALDRMWNPDERGGDETPSRWAEAERRFTQPNLLPAARDPGQPTVPGPNGRGLVLGESFERIDELTRQIWATLQELAGVTTPFTDDVTKRVEQRVREAHDSALAALKAEYETRLEELRNAQQAAHAARLRDRLLQLAGHGER